MISLKWRWFPSAWCADDETTGTELFLARPLQRSRGPAGRGTISRFLALCVFFQNELTIAERERERERAADDCRILERSLVRRAVRGEAKSFGRNSMPDT